MKYDYYKVLKKEVEEYMASNEILYENIKDSRFDLGKIRNELLENVRYDLCTDWFDGDDEQAKQAVTDNMDLIALAIDDSSEYTCDYIMKMMFEGNWIWLDEIIRETLLSYVVEAVILETVCSHGENNGDD